MKLALIACAKILAIAEKVQIASLKVIIRSVSVQRELQEILRLNVSSNCSKRCVVDKRRLSFLHKAFRWVARVIWSAWTPRCASQDRVYRPVWPPTHVVPTPTAWAPRIKPLATAVMALNLAIPTAPVAFRSGAGEMPTVPTGAPAAVETVSILVSPTVLAPRRMPSACPPITWLTAAALSVTQGIHGNSARHCLHQSVCKMRTAAWAPYVWRKLVRILAKCSSRAKHQVS